MTPVTLYFIHLVTLAIPALIALGIRKRVEYRYKPILVFLWVVIAWELIRFVTAESGFLGTLAANTQVLVEALVILWVARRWNLFERKPLLYFLLPLLLIFLWGGDKMFNGLSGYSWSNVACSVVVIGLAVLFLTRTLFTSFSSIFQNPVYLFGAALLIHFGAAAVIEGLLLIARPTGAGAAETLFYLGIAVNILVNLIYLKTILCISKAARFSYA